MSSPGAAATHTLPTRDDRTTAPTADATRRSTRSLHARWGVVVAIGAGVWLAPPPPGVDAAAWRLLAIFLATIAGLMLQPLPVGAMALVGLTTAAITRTVPVAQILSGYSESSVWMVLAAFILSRAMIKTGFGRRVALLFIRFVGHTSLGLSYALVGADAVLGLVIPSTGARSGGVIFPIAKSISDACDSQPGPTARRLGAYLMVTLYQSDMVVAAMFLTAQASNPLIARLARQSAHVDLGYGRWALAMSVPGPVALLAVPALLYRIFPPEIARTPAAAERSRDELRRLGPLSRDEWLMLAMFAGITVLWATIPWHGIDYAVVALAGVSVLLVTRVLAWDDVLSEKAGWDVFVWYGAVFLMARALGDTGITTWFAGLASSSTAGWHWSAAVAALLLLYFYAHYMFASITAHVAAMYVPFLVVMLASGAPPYLTVLLLTVCSNLSAALTHYGTTNAPLYFGAGYVTQRTWWRLGFTASLVAMTIFLTLGVAWWKFLGWW